MGDVYDNSKLTIEFGCFNPNLENNKIIFPNNKIVTTKYNLLSWGPKSLLLQFRRIANIYFLIVSILTCMSFSPKQPASMIGTFAFVLVATMVKEAIEDYSRYKQDKQANNRLVWKANRTEWIQVRCWTLMPGDIIKIEKDEEFSADTLIIKSNKSNGYCYIDTKNLDGETNLKEKASIEEFRDYNDYDLKKLEGNISCDQPNENLANWTGKMSIDAKEIYCKFANIIFKGCVLKNTEYVYGIVVYSGKNTKIMKNSFKAKIKISKVLHTMNILLYSVFFFDILLCLTFALFNYKWVNERESTYKYLFPSDAYTYKGPIRILIYFCVFFVAYSHMIPISLYVALEMVKIFQGLLIYYDKDIYDNTINKPALCRSTDLIEELGQVEFIFSDKTGTLTQNVMVLKKMYVHGRVYGSLQTEDPQTKFTINGDKQLINNLTCEETNEEERKNIFDFLYLLSLCHSVFPEEKDGKIIFQGASPDEIALTKGSQQLGVEFVKKDYNDMIISNHVLNHQKIFELKVEMPFDSIRKRMSVIVKNKETNEYFLLSKGADTTMLPRIILDTSEINKKEEINRVIKVLSKEGLRVLVMGQKKIKERDYLDWERRYIKARNNLRESDSLDPFYEEIENSLNFVGCTAIEDKLQEGVGETIYTLLTCNIRIWVLTGDKQDTAEEIAKSCKLINENMFILSLVEDRESTEEKIIRIKNEFRIELDENEKINCEKVSKTIRKIRGKDMSIIVDGYTLEQILVNPLLSSYFFHTAIAAKSVVCCRVTPKQKSEVVSLAKKYGKWITLSIGDGANDVPMIMEAHIGIGIQGKEGTQAVRSSDFSIGQFRFLEKLLLNYGRIGYLKISRFICYYFYKNIILVFTDIFFNFTNGFSGQIFFADYLSTLYNALYTSWPCLFTFSLDRDVDINITKKFPILYQAGQKNFFFNMKVFWSYIFYAMFHGFLCYFVSCYGLKEAIDNSGMTLNHWYKSTVSFSLVIHIVSYKLLVISNFWNTINLFSTFFSILFYYLSLIILSWNPISFSLQNELAGVFFNLISYSKFWLVIIACPFIAILPDITFKQIFYSAFPDPIDYILRHLRDPDFHQMVFNEDSYMEIFRSKDAEEAEIILKEILKEAREKKYFMNHHHVDPFNYKNVLVLKENREGDKNLYISNNSFDNSQMSLKIREEPSVALSMRNFMRTETFSKNYVEGKNGKTINENIEESRDESSFVSNKERSIDNNFEKHKSTKLVDLSELVSEANNYKSIDKLLNHEEKNKNNDNSYNKHLQSHIISSSNDSLEIFAEINNKRNNDNDD